MRINKFIAQSGVCSRRKADELILQGKVKVNNKISTNLGTDIKETDKVEVLGKTLSLSQNLVYFMLNKPKGIICSANDEKNRKTVLDIVKSDERIYPVGRLDYDSEGLILLTNDGNLSYVLTHPKMQIPKTYVVKIKGDIKESELAVLRNGVKTPDVKYNKCKVKVLEKDKASTKLEIVLTEGKNREIRNMLDFIGKEITLLKRVKFAELKLGSLNRGEYRPLKDYEIEYLKSLQQYNTLT